MLDASEERLRNYTTDAMRLVPRLEDELIAELGFTGKAVKRLKDDRAVLFALAMAYVAGTKAGRVELAAEAKEQLDIDIPAELVDAAVGGAPEPE